MRPSGSELPAVFRDASVAQWISERLEEGAKHHEIAVFVRSEAEAPRAEAAAELAGARPLRLGGKMELKPDHLPIATMHLAKGIEFRAVAVIACDEEILPLQERIESVADVSDLEEVYRRRLRGRWISPPFRRFPSPKKQRNERKCFGKAVRRRVSIVNPPIKSFAAEFRP